ncbi:MAG: ATP-binding protein [Pseudomonadota bacterium]
MSSVWENGAAHPDSHWRSMAYFGAYRAGLAALLLGVVWLFGGSLVFGSHNLKLFVYGSLAYLAFAVLCLFLIRARMPRFNLQLTAQVVGDVVFLVLLTYASGGMESGLGLLLLAMLAAASLVSRGGLAWFYAALASIAVLGEQSYEVLKLGANPAQYTQAGMLSLGYFAIAWLARTLAHYTRASEQLAAQRGIDLANLAQVNQLVIQDMQDGVLVVDERGVIRQRNAQAETMLGAPVAREPKLDEYSPGLAGQWQRWRLGDDSGSVTLNGTQANQTLAARFVPVGQSRDSGAVIFLEDWSRVQSQAQQMKLAALGRLTANIAHEIRNPLSAIHHAAELLQEEKGVGETQTRLAQIIRDNAQRLDRMVQEVLKLNRRDRAHQEALHLDSFLRGFVEQFCQVEKIEPGTFRLQIDPGLMASFDRSHLNQVMWNLCRNAYRYCRRGEGSIVLYAGSAGVPGVVNLDVSDDGPGVEDEAVAHLFEPFFTTVTSGTGLGLYIARELCEANRASLDYAGGSGGARFRVRCRRA